MKDIRHAELAKVLVNHSCRVARGEKVLISGTDVPVEFLEAVVEEVYRAGGYPSVESTTERIKRAILNGADEQSLDAIADWEAFRMSQMDAFIGVRGFVNPKETSDLPQEKNQLYMKHIVEKVHRKVRIPNTKWVVLRYPTPGMAMMAGASTNAFEDYYYDVTTGVDYARMEQAMKKAQTFLEGCDSVHIQGPGTDLKFSVKNIPWVPCFGRINIPDGEIYSAPVKDSIEGVLSYNTPSTYFGFTFSDVKLTFSNGKIVDAQANDTARINTVFNTDEGARYVGEFALGCNPNIKTAMDETLFDEKIEGSFHFTPGMAYETANNGNVSAIHWDMVCIQRPEYGGGTIHMDGKLVREDGIFVHEALAGLNPQNLLTR